MTNPDELERLARAATPGPWIRSGCRRKMGDEDCIMVGPDGFLIAALPIGQPRDHAGAFNDAAFIAAANPATILALLSANREMREALEEARTLDRGFYEWLIERDLIARGEEVEWGDIVVALTEHEIECSATTQRGDGE